MTRYQNHAGFQVSSNKLQVVEVNNVNKQFVLENIDEEFYSDFFSFRDQETKFISVLQNTFNELTFRKPLTSNFISFTLPSTVFSFFDLPYDEGLTKKDFEEYINWELSVLMPGFSRNELAVQSIKLDNSRLRKGKNVIVSVIPKNVIQALSKFCLRNNLNLRYVDNEHFASNNLLHLQNKITTDSISLTLLIRENYFSLTLLEGSLPVYFTISKYKGMNELVFTLQKEIKRVFDNVNSDKNISNSFLFGDYFSEPVVEKIKSETGFMFEALDPFKNIKMSEGLAARKVRVKQPAQFSAAAGIAYRLV